MEIKLLSHIPEKPVEFYEVTTKRFLLPEEEVFKLYFLSLRITSLSDVPIYKFLERTPSFTKFDELDKREFLLTLSFHTIRELLREHFDLKFAKNLYVFLRNKFPPFFLKDCAPRREVIVSQDLKIDWLTLKEKESLPPYLKVRHLHFIFKISGICEEVIRILPSLGLFIVKKLKDNFFEIYFTLSLAEFIYLSQVWMEKGYFKKSELDPQISQLHSMFPECFGEL